MLIDVKFIFKPHMLKENLQIIKFYPMMFLNKNIFLGLGLVSYVPEKIVKRRVC